MANVNAPRGARIYGTDYLSHPYLHSVNDSAAIYPGDFVKTTAGYCACGTAAARLLGVADNYVAASTAGVVMVHDDPRQEFIIKDDGVVALSQAEVGENCEILATAGNSTLKISKMALLTTGHATTTAQLHIVRAADTRNPDGSLNEIGAYCDWVVLINEHERGPAENVGT